MLWRGCLPGGWPRLELDIAVHELQLDVVPLAQLPGDPVGDRDRTVSAAGAADRDRQMLLALRNVRGQQELEQRHQPAVELTRLGPRLDVFPDRLVETRQRPELIDVVRVGQEADVEREIGI